MAPWLYLDNARLGQMSPAAQIAHADFARLVGLVGAAIQFQDFVQHGFDSLASDLQHRLPGLASWQGIAELKRSLRRLARLDDSLPVLIASRSAELMKFAAILLCRTCRNILVTDLGWPPYHRILEAECRRTNRRLSCVPLASLVLCERLNADEIVERVHDEYVKNNCDSLFITAVSNRGIRLPVGRIVRQIQHHCRFVVVDGAQDFCHVGLDVPHNCCDLYLAGPHKWLGGHLPLGIAFYGRNRSRSFVSTMLARALATSRIDDPILRFIEGIERNEDRGTGETANLTALFSCGGAVADADPPAPSKTSFEGRMSNASRVSQLAAEAGWIPLAPHHSLQSGIVLVQGQTPDVKDSPADATRRAFQEQGVALTAYDGGLLRISMPSAPLKPHESGALAGALRELA